MFNINSLGTLGTLSTLKGPGLAIKDPAYQKAKEFSLCLEEVTKNLDKQQSSLSANVTIGKQLAQSFASYRKVAAFHQPAFPIVDFLQKSTSWLFSTEDLALKLGTCINEKIANPTKEQLKVQTTTLKAIKQEKKKRTTINDKQPIRKQQPETTTKGSDECAFEIEALTVNSLCAFWEAYISYFEEGFRFVQKIKDPLSAFKKASADTMKKGVSKKIFGVSLEELARREEPAYLPPVLETMLAHISNNVAMEGIFRVSGSKATIDNLRDSIDQGVTPDFDAIPDPHTVPSLFKTFLRMLPVSLIPYETFSSMPTLSTATMSKEAILTHLRTLINNLPRAHFHLLGRLLGLCQKIVAEKAATKMNSSNIAVVLGPSIIRAPENPHSAESFGDTNTAIQFLVEYYQDLYPEKWDSEDASQEATSDSPRRPGARPGLDGATSGETYEDEGNGEPNFGSSPPTSPGFTLGVSLTATKDLYVPIKPPQRLNSPMLTRNNPESGDSYGEPSSRISKSTSASSIPPAVPPRTNGAAVPSRAASVATGLKTSVMGGGGSGFAPPKSLTPPATPSTPSPPGSAPPSPKVKIIGKAPAAKKAPSPTPPLGASPPSPLSPISSHPPALAPTHANTPPARPPPPFRAAKPSNRTLPNSPPPPSSASPYASPPVSSSPPRDATLSTSPSAPVPAMTLSPPLGGGAGGAKGGIAKVLGEIVENQLGTLRAKLSEVKTIPDGVPFIHVLKAITPELDKMKKIMPSPPTFEKVPDMPPDSDKFTRLKFTLDFALKDLARVLEKVGAFAEQATMDEGTLHQVSDSLTELQRVLVANISKL